MNGKKKPVDEEINDWDFSFLSDVVLGLMHNDCLKYPEDKDFRYAIMKELKRREKRGRIR